MKIPDNHLFATTAIQRVQWVISLSWNRYYWVQWVISCCTTSSCNQWHSFKRGAFCGCLSYCY